MAKSKSKFPESYKNHTGWLPNIAFSLKLIIPKNKSEKHLFPNIVVADKYKIIENGAPLLLPILLEY